MHKKAERLKKLKPVPVSHLTEEQLAKLPPGQTVTEKHGWPLRTVVPQRYFWKSAKWLRKIEFLKEERFSGEALPIPEDDWTHKKYD